MICIVWIVLGFCFFRRGISRFIWVFLFVIRVVRIFFCLMDLVVVLVKINIVFLF